MENKKALEADQLNAVTGGVKENPTSTPIIMGANPVGGAIMAKCAKCGKEFKAGNAGVNHNKYPLETICPECRAK